MAIKESLGVERVAFKSPWPHGFVPIYSHFLNESQLELEYLTPRRKIYLFIKEKIKSFD